MAWFGGGGHHYRRRTSSLLTSLALLVLLFPSLLPVLSSFIWRPHLLHVGVLQRCSSTTLSPVLTDGRGQLVDAGGRPLFTPPRHSTVLKHKFAPPIFRSDFGHVLGLNLMCFTANQVGGTSLYYWRRFFRSLSLSAFNGVNAEVHNSEHLAGKTELFRWSGSVSSHNLCNVYHEHPKMQSLETPSKVTGLFIDFPVQPLDRAGVSYFSILVRHMACVRHLKGFKIFSFLPSHCLLTMNPYNRWSPESSYRRRYYCLSFYGGIKGTIFFSISRPNLFKLLLGSVSPLASPLGWELDICGVGLGLAVNCLLIMTHQPLVYESAGFEKLASVSDDSFPLQESTICMPHLMRAPVRSTSEQPLFSLLENLQTALKRIIVNGFLIAVASWSVFEICAATRTEHLDPIDGLYTSMLLENLSLCLSFCIVLRLYFLLFIWWLEDATKMFRDHVTDFY